MTPLPVTHVPDRRRVSSLLAATGTEVSPSLCAFVLLSAAQGDTDGCIRLLEVTDILPSQATMPAPAAVTCSHSGDPLTVLRIACSIPWTTWKALSLWCPGLCAATRQAVRPHGASWDSRVGPWGHP